MSIQNCSKCGKMFHYNFGEKLCRDCKDTLIDEFNRVKKFIQKNKKVSITEVSKNCDVTTKQILKWVRDEKLRFENSDHIGIDCMACGKNIPYGRYCEECKAKIVKGFNEPKPKRILNPFAQKKQVSAENRYRFNK